MLYTKLHSLECTGHEENHFDVIYENTNLQIDKVHGI